MTLSMANHELIQYSHGTDLDGGSSMIMQESTDRLVAMGLSYSTHIVGANADSKLEDDIVESKLANADWNRTRAFYSYEGTMLMLYFVDGVMHLSTKSRLNAFTCRWSQKGRMFGDLFLAGIHYLSTSNNETRKWLMGEEEEMEGKEDTGEKQPLPPKSLRWSNTWDALQHAMTSIPDHEHKTFYFLVRNDNKGRVVSYRYTNDVEVYYMGTHDNRDFTPESIMFDEDIQVPTPPEIICQSAGDVVAEVQKMDPFNCPGILVYATDISSSTSDVESECDETTTSSAPIYILNVVTCAYTYLYFHVRGNVADVIGRYLQIRANPLLNADLRNLYPYQEPIFDRYEVAFEPTVNILFETYKEVYIFKRTQPPPWCVDMMKVAQNWYVRNLGSRKRMTQETMRDLFQDQPPQTQKNMIEYCIQYCIQ